MARSGAAGRNGPAMIRAALPAGLIGLIGLVGSATAQTGVELVSRTELRVCADPNNLPFSNDKREGFENKIAEILGKELDLPVSYVWFPQVVGFVRNTLRARQCDLVMGTVSGDGIMDNTNAYYHSGYYIKHEALPLKAAFLDSEPDSTRLDFRIAMGVRPGEPEWRRRINGALEKHRAEVNQVLESYDVPLLDEQGRPVTGPAGQ